jgi:hypothetical protein
MRASANARRIEPRNEESIGSMKWCQAVAIGATPAYGRVRRDCAEGFLLESTWVRSWERICPLSKSSNQQTHSGESSGGNNGTSARSTASGLDVNVLDLGWAQILSFCSQVLRGLAGIQPKRIIFPPTRSYKSFHDSDCRLFGCFPKRRSLRIARRRGSFVPSSPILKSRAIPRLFREARL